MVALPGQALLQLIIGSTILPALIYGSIVVLYLGVRRRLERKEGGFNLGRCELPVTAVALIWVAFALFVLVTPDDALVPNLIVVGLILAGGLYFAKMMIFNREVLDVGAVSSGAGDAGSVGIEVASPPGRPASVDPVGGAAREPTSG
jgi:ABC-type xylose transport system permease subunit